MGERGEGIKLGGVEGGETVFNVGIYYMREESMFFKKRIPGTMMLIEN